MLPPVLEIYLVWHPDDADVAAPVADALLRHFLGDTFSGLIGGAVEVYVRSEGWTEPKGAPRPLPLPGTATQPQPAAFVAVVPLVGNKTARALRDTPAWADYLTQLVQAQEADGAHVRVLPAQLQEDAHLPDFLGSFQLIAAKNPTAPKEDRLSQLRRDLTQALAQFMTTGNAQIQVFVSHTKRSTRDTETEAHALINTVREVLRNTRLGEFFDANTIQPGEDWAAALRANAAAGAMLVVRSDLYASRYWCHTEVATAKTHGLPVVTLDALRDVERRGSFLLDHVPRVPARRAEDSWTSESILRALGLLVDECLKRALWTHQKALAETATKEAGKDTGITWWAPHAPEPLTLAHWLAEDEAGTEAIKAREALILHPDPPLTGAEQETLARMATLSGLDSLEVLTPRTFAARGGA